MRFDFIALYALVGTAFFSTSIAVEPRLTFSKRVFSNPDLSATKVAGQAIPIANSQAQSLASLLYQLSKAVDEDTDFKKSKTSGSSLPVSGAPAPPKPATPPKKETPSPKKESTPPKNEPTPPKKEEEDDETT